MKLHSLVNQSFEVFLQQAEGTRIILLHPRSRYRSMLIARLINTPDLNVFYYAMGPDDIKLHAFLAAITHDLANQHPTFGRHTNMLPQNVYENPERHLDTVLETFARDLSEISDDRFYLVLDEYDRSDSADDVQRFVEKLAGYLPDNCRIVINSRTLPRLSWVSLIAEKYAIMLEDDAIVTSNFYDSTLEGSHTLEVYALGPGFVLTDGDPVDSWEGHLPRLLFFFALDCPVVTRSEICQAFWPDLESDQAVNVFHVTKRRLHKALDIDILVHDDGYYRINPDIVVYYDANEFASLLMKGRTETDPDARFDAWQRAADLYRGPFLQGHNDGWINERSRNYRAGYLEALNEMAEVWIARDRHEQALTLLLKGLNEDIKREDMHRKVMQLYSHLGRRSEAAVHYQRLLDEKVPISDETKRLYKEIMG
jgi:DNA-binding SARP family transcriptional activator